MRIFKILALFLLIAFNSLAQYDQIGRFETDFNWEVEDFKVISNEEKGALVVMEERTLSGRDFVIRFIQLDKDLNVQWTDSINLSKIFYIKGLQYENGKNYVLLQDRNNDSDIKIITVDVEDRQIIALENRRLTGIALTDFLVLGNSAILAGYIGSSAVVFVYDLEKRTLKTLNNLYRTRSDLVEVKLNNDEFSFNVLISVLDEKNDKTIEVNTFDAEGELIRAYQLQTAPFYQLKNGVSSSIYNIEQVVTGFYSYKSNSSPVGVYINHIDRMGQQKMNYLPFGDFDTFYDHEGIKKAERLKEKSKRRFENEKFYRYRAEAIFQPMVEKNGKLIVMAEIFKPWNRSLQSESVQSREGPRPKNTWVMNSSAVIIGQGGFDFLSLFAFSLDQKGVLQWDQSTSLDKSIRGALTSYGRFKHYKDSIYYAHYYDESFAATNLTTATEPVNVSLALLNESDQVRFESEYFGDVLSWYENRYLVYGIQHIRDSNNPKELRKVYFVNGVKINLSAGTKSLE